MSNDYFSEKIFMKLWIPSIISAVGLGFADMADALVVGNRMGAVGLAAISMCLPIYMVINIIMHSLGLGGSTRYSRLLGEGDIAGARQCCNDVIKFALLLGLGIAAAGNILIRPVLWLLGARTSSPELYTAAGQYARMTIAGTPLFFLNYILNYFLRNDNKQKLATLGLTAANLCDIGMNILFVLVMDMGAFGAALSTVLGQLIAVLIYLPGLRGNDCALRLERGWPGLDRVWTCFRSGLSVSVQYLFQMVFLLVANNVLFRTAGEEGVAVFDLVQNVSFLVIYLYDGTSKAMQPLLSTYYGECNLRGIHRTRRLGLRFGSIVGCAVIAAIFLMPDAVCSFFGLNTPTVQAVGRIALRRYCIGAVFAGISTILENYEQACERETNAVMLAFLRGEGILLLCTLVFGLIGGTYFWLLYPVTEILSLGLYLLWKDRKGQKEVMRSDKVCTHVITNSHQEISELSGQIADFCDTWEVSPKKSYIISMAVEEIAVAMMNHAFADDADGFICVNVILMEDGTLELHLRDNASPFDPFSLNSGKASEDDFNMDGMGMTIIRKRAKEVFYRNYQGFNTVVVKA